MISSKGVLQHCYRFFIYFSYTFQKIHNQNNEIWMFQRYHLIKDYFSRPKLAPPLSIVFYICLFLTFIIRKVSKKSVSNDKTWSEYCQAKCFYDSGHKFSHTLKYVPIQPEFNNSVYYQFHHLKPLKIAVKWKYRKESNI